jgi:hypothetical protein
MRLSPAATIAEAVRVPGGHGHGRGSFRGGTEYRYNPSPRPPLNLPNTNRYNQPPSAQSASVTIHLANLHC